MLALTSPTRGGRSVGIVRLRTTATEFSLIVINLTYLLRVIFNVHFHTVNIIHKILMDIFKIFLLYRLIFLLSCILLYVI
jgi:hypothetical protein